MRRLADLVAGVLLIVLVGGCAGPAKRHPVPAELVDQARIPGFPDARYVGQQGVVGPGFERRIHELVEQSKTGGALDQPARLLAISGGGANGAFGAGLLVGWTAAGDRPDFQYVTGISTGALTAPFAFLGPDYDDELKEAYTTYSTKQLVEKRPPLRALLSGDSLFRTRGLEKMIARYFDDDAIDVMAREHQKGRRLWIGTTNLDAMQPVYWNIGAIAQSDHPGRYDLVRKILLASASIPVAFPPVTFDVEAGGQAYDELHVDGGMVSQVFAYPLPFEMRRELSERGIRLKDPRLYIIRNAKVTPAYRPVDLRVLPIARQSVESLIRTQGIGDLYELYVGTQRDHVGYYLTHIPSDFDVKEHEAFDPAYMAALFDRGYEMAKAGYPWDREPPDLNEDDP